LKIKHLQRYVGAFSFVCEQFANKIAIRENQYILLANTVSQILFAKVSFFVRKAFFSILSSNISNLFQKEHDLYQTCIHPADIVP